VAAAAANDGDMQEAPPIETKFAEAILAHSSAATQAAAVDEGGGAWPEDVQRRKRSGRTRTVADAHADERFSRLPFLSAEPLNGDEDTGAQRGEVDTGGPPAVMAGAIMEAISPASMDASPSSATVPPSEAELPIAAAQADGRAAASAQLIAEPKAEATSEQNTLSAAHQTLTAPGDSEPHCVVGGPVKEANDADTPTAQLPQPASGAAPSLREDHAAAPGTAETVPAKHALPADGFNVAAPTAERSSISATSGGAIRGETEPGAVALTSADRDPPIAAPSADMGNGALQRPVSSRQADCKAALDADDPGPTFEPDIAVASNGTLAISDTDATAPAATHERIPATTAVPSRHAEETMDVDCDDQQLVARQPLRVKIKFGSAAREGSSVSG
jgi:hypothetical protein